MKKYLLYICLGFCSCYKPSGKPPDNSPPVYTILMGYDANLKDSAVTVNAIKGDSSYLFLNFSLVSGDPSAYPLTCYLTGLPAGVTVQPDSVSFRMNDHCLYKIYVSNAADSAADGAYTVYLNVYNTSLGLQTYPLNLKINPE